jgi:hypothetical protein
LDCRTLGVASYQCFERFFVDVNARARRIEVSGQGDTEEILVIGVDMEGIDTLWEVAMGATHAEVVRLSIGECRSILRLFSFVLLDRALFIFASHLN